MMINQDHFFMQRAIALAHKAGEQNEVPVGAVLVLGDDIIGEGWNTPISSCDPTAHAEINALRHAALTLNNYRLIQTTLYVTLEPCIMCLGALTHARVGTVVFGAYDKRVGAVKYFKDIAPKLLNHRLVFKEGLAEEACGSLLKNFFRERR